MVVVLPAPLGPRKPKIVPPTLLVTDCQQRDAVEITGELGRSDRSVGHCLSSCYVRLVILK